MWQYLSLMALQTDIIHRLSGGGQSGRASAAEKALETIKAEGNLVPKPFVPKKRSFAFPNPERMGTDGCLMMSTLRWRREKELLL